MPISFNTSGFSSPPPSFSTAYRVFERKEERLPHKSNPKKRIEYFTHCFFIPYTLYLISPPHIRSAKRLVVAGVIVHTGTVAYFLPSPQRAYGGCTHLLIGLGKEYAFIILGIGMHHLTPHRRITSAHEIVSTVHRIHSPNRSFCLPEDTEPTEKKDYCQILGIL